MRISWIFFLILLLLLASLVTIFILPVGGNSTVGWIARLSCVVAVILMIVFYWSVMKPMRTILNGIDLLREQDFSSRLAHVNQYEADGIVDMFNGMMSSLKEERLRMREQNHFLDLLIDVSPMGIIILDDNDRIFSANPSACNFLESDKESLYGKALCELQSQLGQKLQTLAPDDPQTVRLNDSMIYRCQRLSFMDKGFAHPFILIEKLTAEVIKAEKKSYEKVIRVIAHEVNNTMAAINSMLSTADMILSDDPDKNRDLLEVIKVCEGRCGSMSRFITSLAEVVKIPEARLIKTDLNNEINRLRVLLESMCNPRNIRLDIRLSSESIPVSIDPVLMEQAIINIVKNSAESIGNCGEITIDTSATPPTLIIADNGPGISAETANMLFSPFFSTKTNGHGIGLMLTSEVLRKHGCKFSLETCSDDLTRFTIRFATAKA